MTADARNDGRTMESAADDATARVTALLAADAAVCGQRAAAISNAYYDTGGPAYYTKPCIRPRGHGTHHEDADGYTWQESVR
jgi:hypothetical protein